MRKPKKEIQLTSYDELLGINEAEQNTLNQMSGHPEAHHTSLRNWKLERNIH